MTTPPPPPENPLRMRAVPCSGRDDAIQAAAIRRGVRFAIAQTERGGFSTAAAGQPNTALHQALEG